MPPKRKSNNNTPSAADYQAVTRAASAILTAAGTKRRRRTATHVETQVERPPARTSIATTGEATVPAPTTAATASSTQTSPVDTALTSVKDKGKARMPPDDNQHTGSSSSLSAGTITVDDDIPIPLHRRLGHRNILQEGSATRQVQFGLSDRLGHRYFPHEERQSQFGLSEFELASSSSHRQHRSLLALGESIKSDAIALYTNSRTSQRNMALAEAQQAFLQASVFPVNINSIGSVRTSNALINDRLTILNEAFLCPKDMLGAIHMELPIHLEFYAKPSYFKTAIGFKDFFIAHVNGAQYDFYFVPNPSNMTAATRDDLTLALRRKQQQLTLLFGTAIHADFQTFIDFVTGFTFYNSNRIADAFRFCNQWLRACLPRIISHSWTVSGTSPYECQELWTTLKLQHFQNSNIPDAYNTGLPSSKDVLAFSTIDMDARSADVTTTDSRQNQQSEGVNPPSSALQRFIKARHEMSPDRIESNACWFFNNEKCPRKDCKNQHICLMKGCGQEHPVINHSKDETLDIVLAAPVPYLRGDCRTKPVSPRAPGRLYRRR